MLRVKKRHVELGGESMTVPQVVSNGTIDYDEFVDVVSNGDRSTANEVISVISRIQRSMSFMLARGDRVQTPIGTFSVSMGVGERDAFGAFELSPKNARVNFRPSQDMIKEVRERIDIELDSTVSVLRPAIDAVENATVDVPAGTIIPESLVYVRGKNLEFNPANETEGVFLIDANGVETRASVYGRCGARQIVMVVPGVDNGVFRLQVRATRGEDEFEVGEYPGTLTVVETAPAVPSPSAD